MSISVIIPAYNESERITNTLLNIDEYLRKQGQEYEIIVVDDGSIDGTGTIVSELKIQNLNLLTNLKNKGKGYSVRRGLLAARKDYALFTDADGSTPIDELKSFLIHIKNGYDIIIGSRQINGANIIISQPTGRRILGEIFKFLVRTVSGVKGFTDTQCGFKMFKKGVIKNILPKCEINGWAFDPEILFVAKQFKYKIKEVPIVWTNSNRSTVRLNGMIRAIIDLFKIRINIISEKYE